MPPVIIPRVQLAVDVYEDQTLVVRHVFYGDTRQDAMGTFLAHMQVDEFLSSCVIGGCFRGDLKCQAVKTWLVG
jgi:hypothetical protein